MGHFHSMTDVKERCPICWDDIQGHRNLRCNHAFCTKCIDTHISTSVASFIPPSCPCCRTKCELPLDCTVPCGLDCLHTTVQALDIEQVYIHECGQQYARCCIHRAFAMKSEVACIRCLRRIPYTATCPKPKYLEIQRSIIPIAVYLNILPHMHNLCHIKALISLFVLCIDLGVKLRPMRLIDVISIFFIVMIRHAFLFFVLDMIGVRSGFLVMGTAIAHFVYLST